MDNQSSISLEEFRKVVNDTAKSVQEEFPDLFFDYAGMIPNEDESFRYDSSPINTEVFAMTGGDGVHYSLLKVSDNVQPIIMTVPMCFGNSMKSYNRIIAENLYEFLGIGFYNGWFFIEQLCYDNEKAINFYSNENKEDGYIIEGDTHFVKKLRTKLGYKHVPLNNKRLKELETKHFHKLKFNREFLAKYID